ncbi:hypothetical protein BDW74DRAFT_175230 [Aspergillus multicolor]|uniref:uncharacterized protein n=1 Tax=Aspergillus multicolor TaxID=41759 RepID=UPI003CCD1401
MEVQIRALPNSSSHGKLDSLATYPLDLSEEFTRTTYKREQCTFAENPIEDSKLTEFLCTDFLAGFVQYQPVRLEDGIMVSSQWSQGFALCLTKSTAPCGHIEITNSLRDEYTLTSSAADCHNPLIAGPSHVRSAWHIRNTTPGKPHALFTTTHTVPPTEKILRTEVLAIIGIMLSRLRTSSLRDHYIIPVLLISCFNRYRVRVLYGYMSDNGLVIAHSAQHEFATRESRDKIFNTFFSWMASEPIGNTKRLRFGATDR